MLSLHSAQCQPFSIFSMPHILVPKINLGHYQHIELAHATESSPNWQAGRCNQ
jgi:hypothetical protein